MTEVIVTMSKGIPKIEVRGVKGKSCKELTRQLEADLGTVTTSTPTREMSVAEQPATRGAR